jgi:hypothetical protein
MLCIVAKRPFPIIRCCKRVFLVRWYDTKFYVSILYGRNSGRNLCSIKTFQKVPYEFYLERQPLFKGLLRGVGALGEANSPHQVQYATEVFDKI